jgi:hypothetical protein
MFNIHRLIRNRFSLLSGHHQCVFKQDQEQKIIFVLTNLVLDTFLCQLPLPPSAVKFYRKAGGREGWTIIVKLLLAR